MRNEKWEIKLTHGASQPERKHERDAGFDIRAIGFISESDGDVYFNDDLIDHNSVDIKAHERIAIKTGVHIKMPKCQEEGYAYEIQVRPRSGLAKKYGIALVNAPATIDEGYHGEIHILLLNTSNKAVNISNGDRVAQLVINKVRIFDSFDVVDSFDDVTDRGSNGFGSTGKK